MAFTGWELRARAPMLPMRLFAIRGFSAGNAMLAPMMISGAGLGLAVPSVTKAVAGPVPRGDIGKASGSFSMMRQLGGAFGVAILAAVFATAGG